MYKRISVTEFKNDDSIKLEELDLNELKQKLTENKAIIKLHAAPILPLDYLKLAGDVAQIQLPFSPGSEGSGIITHCLNEKLINRKVSFVSLEGSWREYAVVPLENIILLDDDVDLDSAACGFINPITSLGLIHKALQNNAKGVVNLAASGAVGKMINDLAKVNNLNCLNVVRGDQKTLDEFKIKYNNENIISFDQDASEFQRQLKEESQKLNATVCFDPIGGIMTGYAFNNLPMNSTVINYGSLSGKDIEGINAVQARWANKSFQGFSNFNWFQSISSAEKEKYKSIINQYSHSIFKTKIEKSFGFDQVKLAIHFAKSLKGGKKVVLKPYL